MYGKPLSLHDCFPIKRAAIDVTSKVMVTDTIYPLERRRDVEGSLRTLEALMRRHGIELVAIGNGTASRETDKLISTLQTRHQHLDITRVVVSEAGALVYYSSELAANVFPDVEVRNRRRGC